MGNLMSLIRPSTGSRELRRQPLFTWISWLVLLFLYAPIVVLVVFSFNDNRSVVRWNRLVAPR